MNRTNRMEKDRSSVNGGPVPPKQEYSNLPGLKSMFLSPMSLMHIAFPLGIASALCGWGPTYTFWFNFVALIPIAKLLGDATEELDAILNNEILSGLINASFGNAVEMIITISALRANLTEVVKISLLGSVLSNMLLVLGMSFFFGGILGKTSAKSKLHLVAEKEQTFTAQGPMCNVTMLLLSSISFTLPTVFQSVGHEEHILPLSRAGACIMMVSYCAFLFFPALHTQGDIGQPGTRR